MKRRLFSSGVLSSTRTVQVAAGKPQSLEISVAREFISDVFSSVTILGEGIKVSKPGAFKLPAEQDPYSRQQITGDALQDFCAKYKGAQVKITGSVPIEGVLAGHTVLSSNGQGNQNALLIRKGESLNPVAITQINTIQLVDEADQANLTEVLASSIRTTRRGAVPVLFELSSENGGAAEVTHTQPAPPWKLSYRISGSGSNRRLEALAVVANRTCEHWVNEELTLVNAGPVDFSTDLADAKMLERSQISVSQGRAVNAVQPDRPRVARAASARGLMASPESLSLASVSMDDADERAGSAPSAFNSSAEQQSVGGYFAYTVSGVSIDRDSIALVPLFSNPLEVKEVLFYNSGQAGTEPYRSLTFTNNTGKVLGLGVCSVSDGNDYLGKSVLQVSQPNDQVILPFGLEQRVRVTQDRRPTQNTTLIGVSTSKHYFTTVRRTTLTSSYSIENNLDSLASVTIQVTQTDANATFACGIAGTKVERTANGARITVDVPGNSKLEVPVIETIDGKSQIRIDEEGGSLGGYLATEFENFQDEGLKSQLQPVMVILEAIKDNDEQTAELDSKISAHEGRISTLLEYLEKAGNSAAKANDWQSELGKKDGELQTLQESNTKLEQENEELNRKLAAALKGLTIEWQAQTA